MDRFGLLATTVKNAKTRDTTVSHAFPPYFSPHYFIKTFQQTVKQKVMGYLFTSESVSEGHPDKVADQISDAVLDKLFAFDPNSKVACETLVTTGQVILAG